MKEIRVKEYLSKALKEAHCSEYYPAKLAKAEYGACLGYDFHTSQDKVSLKDVRDLADNSAEQPMDLIKALAKKYVIDMAIDELLCKSMEQGLELVKARLQDKEENNIHIFPRLSTPLNMLYLACEDMDEIIVCILDICECTEYCNTCAVLFTSKLAEKVSNQQDRSAEEMTKSQERYSNPLSDPNLEDDLNGCCYPGTPNLQLYSD